MVYRLGRERGHRGRPVVGRGALAALQVARTLERGTRRASSPTSATATCRTNLWLGWQRLAEQRAADGEPARRTAAPRRASKLYLTYPQKLVREPLIYQLGRKFDAGLQHPRRERQRGDRHRRARARRRREDDRARPSRGCASSGVTVEPIEKNVIE